MRPENQNFVPLPSTCFVTDACKVGSSAHFGTDWFFMSWANDFPAMFGCHINELDLFTAYLALHLWGSELCNRHVCVRSDNIATVAALNTLTSRSAKLMPFVHEIFWLSVKFNITVSIRHIPSKLNILSDRISCLNELTCTHDGHLILSGFSSCTVFLQFSSMTIDSFLWLKDKWTKASRTCVRRLPPLRS